MNQAHRHAALFDYPPRTTYGRVVHKSRIFAAGKPGRRLRDKITQHVDKITWQYNLAPELLNLATTDSVEVIQVFNITLKPAGISDKLPEDILRCIDRAIGSPIIFQLLTGAVSNQTRVAAAYKRPSAAETGKWVISDYFATDWLPIDAPRRPLPVATNMAQLYEHILQQLIPLPARAGESLQALVERQHQASVKQRECERLEKRLMREKQFNRKLAINRELRSSQAGLAALTQTNTSHTSADYAD